MDAILFYETNGERSEATRRRVRSAAAQHSHRIGPRKPKSSIKKPNASTTTPPADDDDDHPAHSTAAAAAAAVSPGIPSLVAGSAGKLTPATFVHAVDPAHAPTATSHPNTLLTDDEKERKRQAAHARWEHVQILQSSHILPDDRSAPQQHYHPATLPLSIPAAPQPCIEPWTDTNPIRPTRSRADSHCSQQISPTTRLPQYSWTEYPRYATGFSRSPPLPIPTQVGGAKEEGFGRLYAPTLTTANSNTSVPGFRRYTAEEQSDPAHQHHLSPSRTLPPPPGYPDAMPGQAPPPPRPAWKNETTASASPHQHQQDTTDSLDSEMQGITS